MVERMVSEQMVEYLQVGGMMPRLQSAYRRHHSTETALLQILSDILSAMDDRRVTYAFKKIHGNCVAVQSAINTSHEAVVARADEVRIYKKVRQVQEF